VQRKTLSPLEAARPYKAYASNYRWDAGSLGSVSGSYAAKVCALLKQIDILKKKKNELSKIR
jgi:hypothetical protein